MDHGPLLANCGGIISDKIPALVKFSRMKNMCCMIAGFENKTCDKIGYDCNCHTFWQINLWWKSCDNTATSAFPLQTMGFLWKHMVLWEYSALITDVRRGVTTHIDKRHYPYNFLGTSSQCPMPGASIQGFFEHQCLVHPRQLTCPLKRTVLIVNTSSNH